MISRYYPLRVCPCIQKGSRSIRTDVQTDSETIYEAFVQLLNSLDRKVSLSGVCVLLSVLCGRGGEIFMDIYLNFSQPKSEPLWSRCIAHYIIG